MIKNKYSRGLKAAAAKLLCFCMVLGFFGADASLLTVYAGEAGAGDAEAVLTATATDCESEMDEEPVATATDSGTEMSAVEALSASQPDGEELLVTEGTGTYPDVKQAMLPIVNQKRAEAGVAGLSIDPDLSAAAEIRAEEISRNFSHTRPNGSSCFTVSDKAYGENIAYGYGSVDEVMTAWMNSDGHKANILSSGYKSIGIACYEVNGLKYWVQLFGINSVATTVYNGVDYSSVYDYNYYVSRNTDVIDACGENDADVLEHFVKNGMKEGRQGCADFNVYSYAYRYADLRNAFKNDLSRYYMHYLNTGKREGRVGAGTTSMQGYVTVYNGVDYSSVYNYNDYTQNYSDIKKVFKLDDAAVLQHFVNYGMKEGRQGCADFDVYSYAYRYADLRRVFKNDLPKYYMHYINTGRKEGRIGTGATTMQNCTTVYNGVDYSALYNGTYYLSKYADIRKAYGFDDAAILQHFVNAGMKEGRQGSEDFNVYTYKNRYADLQKAFGNNLTSYYMHYLNTGIKEGRSGK